MNEIVKKRGGQPGNRNACKHGYFSIAMDQTVELNLKKAFGLDEIDQYIRDVRARLENLLKTQPETDLAVSRTVEVLAGLIGLRKKLQNSFKRSLYIRNFAKALSQMDCSSNSSSIVQKTESGDVGPALALRFTRQ